MLRVPQTVDAFASRIIEQIDHFETAIIEEELVEQSGRYQKQYGSLVDLASKINADTAEQLALAVYGWMPTILRHFRKPDEDTLLRLRTCKTKSVGERLRELQHPEDKSPPVNRSWVGTSKFLHFLNPDVFPIWDSRIARVFGFTTQHQINSARNYEIYTSAMHDAMEKILPIPDRPR